MSIKGSKFTPILNLFVKNGTSRCPFRVKKNRIRVQCYQIERDNLPSNQKKQSISLFLNRLFIKKCEDDAFVLRQRHNKRQNTQYLGKNKVLELILPGKRRI